MAPTNSDALHLVADGTDVVVLLQLLFGGSGQTLDLVDSVTPQQEALPAQLCPQPHVVVGVNQHDGGAHYSPFSEYRLAYAVRHHAQRHHELQHPVSAVHAVDHVVHVLHWYFTQLLHHEENIDQQCTQHLRTRQKEVRRFTPQHCCIYTLKFCMKVE